MAKVTYDIIEKDQNANGMSFGAVKLGGVNNQRGGSLDNLKNGDSVTLHYNKGKINVIHIVIQDDNIEGTIDIIDEAIVNIFPLRKGSSTQFHEDNIFNYSVKS